MASRTLNPSPAPPRSSNAFAPEYLERLSEQDEADDALEAELDGEWRVEALRGGGFAVYRSWESESFGDAPIAHFEAEAEALLYAAVLPSLGRDPYFALEAERSPARLFTAGRGGHCRPVATLRHANDAAVAALHVATYLARHPTALASLLAAAGPIAIEIVGAILERRKARAEPPPRLQATSQ